ncbi:MAG: BatD family protein [bacterium]
MLLPAAALGGLLGVFVFSGSALAVEVQASVDKTEATLEDQIILTVSVLGEHSISHPPELPPLPDFEVTRGGKSSRTEISNGQFRSSVEFKFLLAPRRTGTLTIPPVRVRHRGAFEQSLPIQVRILQARAADDELPPAFVKQEVDVESPYVNQQIVYTFRFFRRVQAVEAQWDPPVFQGFWVEDLGKEGQYQQVLGGQSYMVTEIRKALFPLASGSLEIAGNSLTCKLVLERRGGRRGVNSLFDDDFFSTPFFTGGETVTKTLHTDPVRVEVRPLPEAGRPAGFSGLVGTFAIQADVGQERLRVGDSTTLTITVAGEGNLRDLAELPPQEIERFKIYPDKPIFELQRLENRIEGTKIFKKALVPLTEGNLEVPAVELSYFDPAEGTYRIASTAPIPLVVKKAPESEQLHLAQSSPSGSGGTYIQLIGKDILPIHTGLAGARSQVPSGRGLWLSLLGLAFPPGILLACLGLKRRRQIEAHVARRRGAGKKARSGLREAKRNLDRPEDREFYGQISRSLRGLVGDKLDLSALAYTPAEICRCLVDNGIEPKTAASIGDFLEKLEQLQFGSRPEEARQRQPHYKEAEKLLRLLDKRL